MIKKILKSVLIIILLTIIVQAVISSNNYSFALGDVTKDTDWVDWEPRVEGTDELSKRVGLILGVINVLGVLISVISLSIIGIKIMLGSIEEKANYKQTLKPWAIGATMVFAVTTIPNIVYNLTDNIFVNQENYTYYTEGNRIDGYDEAIISVATYIDEANKNTDTNTYHDVYKNKSYVYDRLKYILNKIDEDINIITKHEANEEYKNGAIVALQRMKSIIIRMASAYSVEYNNTDTNTVEVANIDNHKLHVSSILDSLKKFTKTNANVAEEIETGKINVGNKDLYIEEIMGKYNDLFVLNEENSNDIAKYWRILEHEFEGTFNGKAYVKGHKLSVNYVKGILPTDDGFIDREFYDKLQEEISRYKEYCMNLTKEDACAEYAGRADAIKPIISQIMVEGDGSISIKNGVGYYKYIESYIQGYNVADEEIENKTITIKNVGQKEQETSEIRGSAGSYEVVHTQGWDAGYKARINIQKKYIWRNVGE